MPYAVQYLDPGTQQLGYYDADTGYQIDPADLPYYQVSNQQGPTTKAPTDETGGGDEKTNEDYVYPSYGSDHRGGLAGSVAGPRSMSNNFGYASKPGLLGAAGFMPGPAGMVAKAANVAFNVNNRQAVQDARATLGLEHKNNFGSLISDNKGQVAELNRVDPNNPDHIQTTPVGFETSTPTGRTNLTPNEARNRALTNPGTVTEAKPQDVKDANKNFKEAGLSKPAEHNHLTGNMFHEVTNALGLTHNETSTPSRTSTTGTKGTIGDFNKSDLSESAQNMVSGMNRMGFGDVGVNSDRRSASDNAAVGGARHSQHLDGNAVDLATKNMTDDQREGVLDAALANGAAGVGLYGTGSMHVDTRQGPVTMWGQNPKNPYAGQTPNEMPGWARDDLSRAQEAKAGGFSYMSSHAWGVTPTERPDTQTVGPVAAAEQAPASVNTGIGLAETSAPMQGPDMAAAKSGFTAAPTGMQMAGPNPASANPLGVAAGVNNIASRLSPDDQKMMAMTLAGEIDPSKTKIGTDDFTKEAYGIASTMANRMDKYGNMQGVLSAPKQYSTWNDDVSAKTAVKNYNLNPEAYDNAVKGFLSDDKNNLGFTNYHAATVTPGWSSSMQNPQAIGAHVFGTLPGYEAKASLPSVGPMPEERPALNTAATNVGVMSGPDMAAAQSNHFSGPSQVGTGGPNDSKSGSNSGTSSSGSSSAGGGDRGGGFGSVGGGFGSSSGSTGSFGGRNDTDRGGSQ